MLHFKVKYLPLHTVLAERRGVSTTCRNQIGIGRRSGTDSAKLLLTFPNAATTEVSRIVILVLINYNINTFS